MARPRPGGSPPGRPIGHFDGPIPLGDSLAVKLPALTRASLVRIQVPQPLGPIAEWNQIVSLSQ